MLPSSTNFSASSESSSTESPQAGPSTTGERNTNMAINQSPVNRSIFAAPIKAYMRPIREENIDSELNNSGLIPGTRKRKQVNTGCVENCPCHSQCSGTTSPTAGDSDEEDAEVRDLMKSMKCLTITRNSETKELNEREILRASSNSSFISKSGSLFTAQERIRPTILPPFLHTVDEVDEEEGVETLK